MKTYTFNSIAKRVFAATAVVLFATVLWSCNKDFENRLAPSTTNDTANVNSKTRKVLYIIIDGVRGKAITALNAPNISSLSKNSIYAYNSLSDFEQNSITNASAWSNMLTGVYSGKHNVNSEDFSENRLDQYPSLITRFKQANANLRTAVFGASPAFITNLAADATASQSFAGDDAGVKSAVIEELKVENTSLVVAQFHAVETVAEASGYESTNAAYTDAITQVDTYIGEILQNLKSRKTFAKENWLVVIASSKGGELDTDRTDNTSYGDDSRNNFIIFYNPRFITQVIPKPATDRIPFVGTAPVFYGGDSENRKAIVANDGGLYNFGMNDFTIQFKFKSSGTARTWPVFLSKSAYINNTNPGWLLYLSGKGLSMNVSGGGTWQNFSNNSEINDGKWHTVTVIFYSAAGKRYIKSMTDGILTRQPIEITARGSLDNNVPLQMGRQSGDAANPEVMIKELQMYNVALPEAHVTAYFRKTAITDTHPYYNNLVGYWPANEGTGSKIVNQSPLAAAKDKNFTLTGTYEWRNFNDISPVLDPQISPEFYKIVPNNVDIPFQIYQWMGISVPSSWHLDGKSWNPTYTDIKP